MGKLDFGLGLGSMALGIILYFYFDSLPSDSAFYPKIICYAIILLGAIITITGRLRMKVEKGQGDGKTESSGQKDPKSYRTVLLVVLYLFAYYFLFQVVGYTIPMFLLIVGTVYTLGYRKWKVLLPVALGVSAGLYLVFTQVFRIKFPGAFF
jgi:cobalamin synthase